MIDNLIRFVAYILFPEYRKLVRYHEQRLKVLKETERLETLELQRLQNIVVGLKTNIKQ